MTEDAITWLCQWTGTNKDLPAPPSYSVEIECLDSGFVRYVNARSCYKLTAAGAAVLDGICQK